MARWLDWLADDGETVHIEWESWLAIGAGALVALIIYGVIFVVVIKAVKMVWYW